MPNYVWLWHNTSIYISSMNPFLQKNSENNRLELLIDWSIFSDHIAMKAAYMFLDRAYFFFRKEESNTIVQITAKEWEEWDSERFALEYSDELLAVQLRYKLENDNKLIRETIVKRALASYADTANFMTVQSSQNDINADLDKDIDEILKEIENDPELKVDENEISRILAEIEQESDDLDTKKPITLDPNKIKDAKAKFQARK